MIPGQTPRSRAWWLTNGAPHYIYRCYDANGVLLYIGCTSEVKKRMASHRRGKGGGASRWLSVCMDYYEVDADAHPGRDAGHEAESKAIQAELPPFNLHWAARYAGGGWQRYRASRYLVDHGHIELALETACHCSPDAREHDAYDEHCPPHSAQPGDLSVFDWDAYIAAEERAAQEADQAAAAAFSAAMQDAAAARKDATA